ncbi:MAG TPA: HD domain-containing phosphohydrolase [Phycisphaerae bacterium]|nr:HD domain-containing phosphohydrolase [Phycisphaerae bacterium]
MSQEFSGSQDDGRPRLKLECKNNSKMAPVCYSRFPDDALRGMSLYMRSVGPGGSERYVLYASESVLFGDAHRTRLKDLGVKYIYISVADQQKLRRQLEETIETVVSDPKMSLTTRCEIVYESSIELLSEMLSTRDVEEALPRLRRVADSIVSLLLESPLAFRYMFEAAHHDAYAATHAANAAAWLPALAMAMGELRREAIVTYSMGGLLYDIGMAFMPATMLNKLGKLSTNERELIRQHPELGGQMLRQLKKVDPLIATMAKQHHERLDGTGYPHGLLFDRIPLAVRMVAVIDTYDALTSFRPYRDKEMSPGAALAALKKETPHRFDPQVVEAWTNLLTDACPAVREEQPGETRGDGYQDTGKGRRRFARYVVNCPAQVTILQLVKGSWKETNQVDAVVHNLSRGGLQLLAQLELGPGTYVRARLKAKDNVSRKLDAMVVRVRNCGDGWFEFGSQYVDLAREQVMLPDGEFVEA